LSVQGKEETPFNSRAEAEGGRELHGGKLGGRTLLKENSQLLKKRFCRSQKQIRHESPFLLGKWLQMLIKYSRLVLGGELLGL